MTAHGGGRRTSLRWWPQNKSSGHHRPRIDPLSAVHAAVGRVQLAHFESVVTRRKTLWRDYARALADIEAVRLVDVDIDNTVPFNLVVRVRERDRVFARMKAVGIGVGVHYPPNHLQPAFQRWHRRLPATERTAPELLSLPFHPAMTGADVTTVVAALVAALGLGTTT